MRRASIVVTTAALLATACGGAKPAAKAPAPSSPTTSSTTAASTSSKDCSALGIDPSKMREGTCTHGGYTWVVVDETHTLKLNTLRATLAGIRTTKVLASGSSTAATSGDFVVVSVNLTNELPAPQTFDQAGAQQAGLILGGAVFKEAVAAESKADASSCLKHHGTPIRAGQTATCDVIFDVPTRAAADLGKHGGGDLYLVNFGSDLAGGVLPQTIGQIRLYR